MVRCISITVTPDRVNRNPGMGRGTGTPPDTPRVAVPVGTSKRASGNEREMTMSMKCAVRLLMVACVVGGGPGGWARAAFAERIYLSGKGPSDAVEWQFYCSDGRRSGEWTTIPVPSNWEQQGFGDYDYGHVPPHEKHGETGRYRIRFHAPQEWQDKLVRLVFEGAMTDTSVKINGKPVGSVHQGGYCPFHYLLTDTEKYGEHSIEFGKENELEVLVAKR